MARGIHRAPRGRIHGKEQACPGFSGIPRGVPVSCILGGSLRALGSWAIISHPERSVPGVFPFPTFGR